VLPEYHLTNWLPHVSRFRESCIDSQKYLKKYQALARELSICIVPGTIVEADVDETTKTHVSTTPSCHLSVDKRANVKVLDLDNVAYFIDNKGDILARYVKKNLWGPTERDHLKANDGLPHIAFDTPIGRCGLLICWDLAFPEAWRDLVAQGAKTIILPTFCKLIIHRSSPRC
jgi:predicted amidohydrolase